MLVCHAHSHTSMHNFINLLHQFSPFKQVLRHFSRNHSQSSSQFLQAMRNVPTPAKGGKKRGVTCSSFTSVSLSPPIISICIGKPSRMHNLLLESKIFAIHILSEKQVHLSINFSQPPQDETDPFKHITHTVSETGLPILPHCTAVMECEAHNVHSVGDHHVWYGQVTKVSHGNQDMPLLYYARTYRSIGDESFMRSFETASLAYEDWTHKAHLRMAWNYLQEHDKEEAVPLIKEGIKRFNEKNSDKVKRGYHETITNFFIHMISRGLKEMKGKSHTFEEFLEAQPHLNNSRLLFNYYSQEIINTEEAKLRSMAPDIKPLPSL